MSSQGLSGITNGQGIREQYTAGSGGRCVLMLRHDEIDTCDRSYLASLKPYLSVASLQGMSGTRPRQSTFLYSIKTSRSSWPVIELSRQCLG